MLHILPEHQQTNSNGSNKTDDVREQAHLQGIAAVADAYGAEIHSQHIQGGVCAALYSRSNHTDERVRAVDADQVCGIGK